MKGRKQDRNITRSLDQRRVRHNFQKKKYRQKDWQTDSQRDRQTDQQADQQRLSKRSCRVIHLKWQKVSSFYPQMYLQTVVRLFLLYSTSFDGFCVKIPWSRSSSWATTSIWSKMNIHNLSSIYNEFATTILAVIAVISWPIKHERQICLELKNKLEIQYNGSKDDLDWRVDLMYLNFIWFIKRWVLC